MSEFHLNAELSKLERKINLLLGEHKRVKDELNLILRENERLKNQLNAKNNKLNNFQNKFKISNLVGNMVVETEDVKGLKEILDNYIKEIDKCIAQLSEA